MKTRFYETLMLLTLKTTDEQMADLESTFKTFASNAGGSLVSFDKWGRYRLAYPVRKQEYGSYVLARYELNDVDGFMSELENHMRVRCHEYVMRHVNVALEEDAFKRPYSKPMSLDMQEENESYSQRSRRSDRPQKPAVEKKEAAPAKEAPVAAEENVEQPAGE